MAARLGYVLWWASVAVFVLACGFSAYLGTYEHEQWTGILIMVIAPAVVVLLLGRAARFVLAGD